MTGHLDADRLAAFRAGLLGRRRARRAAAHLATCDVCTGLDAQLTSLTTVLAAVGPAVTTPPDIAARLDAALAQAQAEVAPAPAPSRLSRSRSRSGAPWRSLALPSWRLVAQVAAGVAVIGAGVGFGLSQVGGSTSSGTAAAGSVANPAAAGSGMSRGLPPRPADGEHKPRAAMPSPQYQSRTVPPGPSSSAGSTSAASSVGILYVVRTKIDFEPTTLRAQVEAQLAPRPMSGLSTPARFPAPSAVAACVRAVAGGTAPALVEEARYAGKPAILIAVRHGAMYQVWFVPAGCSGQADILARLTVPAAPTGTSTP